MPGLHVVQPSAVADQGSSMSSNALLSGSCQTVNSLLDSFPLSLSLPSSPTLPPALSPSTQHKLSEKGSCLWLFPFSHFTSSPPFPLPCQ